MGALDSESFEPLALIWREFFGFESGCTPFSNCRVFQFRERESLEVVMVAQREDPFLVLVSIEFRILEELQFEPVFTADATSDRESKALVRTHLVQILG